jgi:hypothetical protein
MGRTARTWQWLYIVYKRDAEIGELGKQQSATGQYLDTVAEVLFSGRKGDVRGVGAGARGSRG